MPTQARKPKATATKSTRVFDDMATRMAGAEENWVESMDEGADLGRGDALLLLAVYKKLKAVKYVAALGRYDVKHGGFLDRDAMGRALALAPELGL